MGNYQNLSVDYDALQPKEEIFKQEDFFKKLIEKYSIKTCLDCLGAPRLQIQSDFQIWAWQLSSQYALE